jgi:hypothetical protein
MEVYFFSFYVRSMKGKGKETASGQRGYFTSFVSAQPMHLCGGFAIP